ncbi:MAG TPA: serine/threonine-protein kinase, partial [Fibrobacteria bacterium]|nr:serine/threonine-protein kinase [Fibrobacteria bacterium]
MGTLDPSERSESFQPGQTFGKFYLVQAIGEGGTSRIYKALQQPISRLVALKIPSFPAGGGVLTPDEFLSEATLMARLDHAGIVRIHDFGVEEGRAFICMEYVEGWNLQELVERFHPLPASAVLAIALQVLEALLHAHARGVLHQDLSPANVLISRAGSAKLADFGMAGKGASAPGGNVVGTPAVLSPEHVAGEPCTARSDLFSFGSLLYFMARGEPLFNPGEGNCRLMEAFREIEKARWQPPLDRLRALPVSLSRLVRSALEGGDPEAMLRDMRDLWVQSEGSTTPEEALRRE